MAKPKILVVYKEKECTQILNKFLGYTRYLSSTDEEWKLDTDIDIREGDEYDLHISTKYYDADVQFVFYHYHPDDIDDMLGAVENLNTVIYLFTSTDELEEFVKFIEQMMDKATAEISMLVYNSSELKMSDKHEKAINQLSIDWFVEFIRTDLEGGYERLDSTTSKAGMLGESKVGMHRVVEALQCNMWDNMVKKPMNFGISQAAKREPQPEITKQESNDTSEEDKIIDISDKDSNNDEKTNFPKDVVQDSINSDQKLASNSDEYRPAPVYLDPLNPLLPIPDYSKSDIPPANEFEKEERNLEELGQLMSQMKDLKDNIKTMSVEERRTNAEEMIKKIAGFMNLSDEIFSSDEEGNVDYDELEEEQDNQPQNDNQNEQDEAKVNTE